MFAMAPAMSATDSLKKHTHQATQNGTLMKLGLLKSGNLMKCWKQERGDPWVAMMERLNSIFRNISCIVIIGLTKSGRAAWQEEEDKRKDVQCCSDSSGTILYLRALQGHSGRSLIDPSLQDNVIIPDGFFKYIYHVGCAIIFTFHHQFRIDTGRTEFEQQTDSVLSAC